MNALDGGCGSHESKRSHDPMLLIQPLELLFLRIFFSFEGFEFIFSLLGRFFIFFIFIIITGYILVAEDYETAWEKKRCACKIGRHIILLYYVSIKPMCSQSVMI